MTLVISHAFAIKVKGFGNWIKSFFQPVFIMFPMNLVGEISKPISHSLRLFGNIYGGGILVLILSYMVKYLILPVVLWGFFGMFIGLIQAMVFSMLTIAYIAGQIE
jgi:F-type H+-transporting ATPase subunit a